MNCKQGDLAIVVRALDPRVNHHIGMVIRCASLTYSHDGVPCWRLETPVKDNRYRWGAVLLAVADHDLRPIRDNPGEDETLTWAPKREGITA